MTIKELTNANKGTVKVAVLEYCPLLTAGPLVAVLVYDTEPVHFLSMCCDEIKWVEKNCSTWDKNSECMRDGRFLWMCINDSYNLHMGNVDVNNQLRGSYWPNAEWMWKMKWWHAYYYGQCLCRVQMIPRDER